MRARPSTRRGRVGRLWRRRIVCPNPARLGRPPRLTITPETGWFFSLFFLHFSFFFFFLLFLPFPRPPRAKNYTRGNRCFYPRGGTTTTSAKIIISLYGEKNQRDRERERDKESVKIIVLLFHRFDPQPVYVGLLEFLDRYHNCNRTAAIDRFFRKKKKKNADRFPPPSK